MNFTFFSPVNIVFGSGKSGRISDHICHLLNRVEQDNKSILLVRGKSGNGVERIIENLMNSGYTVSQFLQSGEPSVDDILEGAKAAASEKCSLVIAAGGGSVIDTGKAISAIAANPGDIMQYLEVIGSGRPLEKRPLPLVAVPTTSGTGAEVTCNAVISSKEHLVKVSLRSRYMYPDTAIIDPELSISMSPELTAATGMDALTQLIESFTSPFATPFTDALCREGLTRVAGSFKKAYDEPENIVAREDMSLAAMLSGITLANAKLGAVHGIAGPMGGMINASHGLICAKLLKDVTIGNIEALKKLKSAASESQNSSGRASHSERRFLRPIGSGTSLRKYDEIARILKENPDADADDLPDYVDSLLNHMKIESAPFPETDSAMISELALKAAKSSSIKGNPVSLTVDAIREILEKTFQQKA